MKWGQVKAKDVIVCPATGQPERVVYSARAAKGRQFVRTVNHDHTRLRGDQVTKVEP